MSRFADEKGPTIGYHKIRGLAAGLRMMCYYKKQNFVNVAYGADMKEKWFGGAKPGLVAQNSCMNLPYILNGNDVVTQSNTCMLYLGQKLGIDTFGDFIHNHTVLDQTMDLRNDLMKLVYSGDKAGFDAAAKAHLAGTGKTNFTKLEGFCKGPFMCGGAPQSGDFALFEMLDQHLSIAASVGAADILADFPKLKALHASLRASPELEAYFAADMYAKWAQNNGLFTVYTGQGEDFVYDSTVEEAITF